MSNSNSKGYIAQPPRPLSLRSGVGSFKFYLASLSAFWRILYQPLVPFSSYPDSPEDPPKPSGEINEKTVDQCQHIYNDTERSRTYLEDKARSTFTFIAFLTPLLITSLVYVLKESTVDSRARLYSMIIGSMVVVFIVLSFISVARAVSVQKREALFLGSVIDFDNADFYSYDSARHCRGLLWCASINAAMNAHIAQFVKGAHVLITLAVLCSCVLLGPLISIQSNYETKPVKAMITDTVIFSSTQLDVIGSQLKSIDENIKGYFSLTQKHDKSIKLRQNIVNIQEKIAPSAQHARSIECAKMESISKDQNR